MRKSKYGKKIISLLVALSVAVTGMGFNVTENSVYAEETSTTAVEITKPHSILNRRSTNNTLTMAYTDSSTSEKADTNYVNTGSVIFNSSTKKTYIKFANLEKFIPNKAIYSATLTLFSPHMSSSQVIIRPVTSAWDADTITANNAPTVSDEIVASATGWKSTSNNTVDVTEYIRRVARGEYNGAYGLQLTSISGDCHIVKTGGENVRPLLTIYYADTDSHTFDDKLELSCTYNPDVKIFTLSWKDDRFEELYPDYKDGESKEDKVKYYIYRIDGSKINHIKTTTDTSITYNLSVAKKGYGVRVVARYVNNENKLETYKSNIVKLDVRKEEYLEEKTNEDGEVVYVDATRDTVVDAISNPVEDETKDSVIGTIVDVDKDGIEDVYEIWDFGTEHNRKDTDGDGFDDGYEVAILESDPAVADDGKLDSDGDGLLNEDEYKHGTHPYLNDSDFDGMSDSEEIVSGTNPLITDGNVLADDADITYDVPAGNYIRQKEMIKGNVKLTLSYNVYTGTIKSEKYDYISDGEKEPLKIDVLDNEKKYFYDRTGNKIAEVKEFFLLNGRGELVEDRDVITYAYDENNLPISFSDEAEKYSITYGEDKEMSSFTLGESDVPIVSVVKRNVELTESDKKNIEEKTEEIKTYANGNTVRTVFTTYIDKENTDDTKKRVYHQKNIYYNGAIAPSYIFVYNQDRVVTKVYDQVLGTSEDPLVYTYTYDDDKNVVSRDDGYKKVQTYENGISTTSYTMKDIDGEDSHYVFTTTISDNEDSITATQNDIKFNTLKTTMYKNSNDVQNVVYHSMYKKNTMTSTYMDEKNLLTLTRLANDIVEGDLEDAYTYEYDIKGNITSISMDGTIIYEYVYDSEGKLTEEVDYQNDMRHRYYYDERGNVVFRCVNNVDSSRTPRLDYLTYQDTNHSDRLTMYNGSEITYDAYGNPIQYYNDMTFEWKQDRYLTGVIGSNDGNVEYRYDLNGYRVYKKTDDLITEYEWDNGKLIRELCTEISTGEKYDIVYRYDAKGEVVGFFLNKKMFSGGAYRNVMYVIHYEKDLQGNVVGLISESGSKIAAYTYDAWGNILTKTGDKDMLAYNHITYRGYYTDAETGFYYLHTRYYDPETGRFINMDDVRLLSTEINVENNLYAYCKGDPVNYIDPNGCKSYSVRWITGNIDELVLKLPCMLETAEIFEVGKGILTGLKKLLKLLRTKARSLLDGVDEWLKEKFETESAMTHMERILGTPEALKPIYGEFTSVGVVVEYVIDCLDGYWDGKLNEFADLYPRVVLK